LNLGNARFSNIAAVSGLDFLDDGRGLAVVDWDQDGDLDLWMTSRIAPQLRFLRNDVPAENHFLALRLVGHPSNRDAIGARVELTVRQGTPRLRVKTLRAGEGFLSQSSKWLHFGLGRSAAIDRVVVRWPHGQREVFTGLQPDRRYRLVEGTGTAEPWSTPKGPLRLKPGRPSLPPMPSSVHDWLVAPYPLRPVTFRDRAGHARVLGDPAGQPVLLVLWASWCRPCVQEIKELIDARDQLEASDLQVVTLSVDDLTHHGSDLAAPRKLLDGLAFPYVSAAADEALLKELQRAHDDLFMKKTPLPIPSSFLLDAAGDLAAIYKGPVTVKRLLADVTRLHLPGDAAWESAVPRTGVWHDRPRDVRVTSYFERGLEAERRRDWPRAARRFQQVASERPGDAEPRYHLGLARLNQQDFSGAVAAFEQVVARDPDYLAAYEQLGDLHLRQGNKDQAIVDYEQAVRIDPNAAEAHGKLGVLLATEHDWKRAEEHLRQAVKLQPDDGGYQNNLGRFLQQQDEYADAIAHYRLALRKKPLSLPAAANLSWLLATCRDPNLRDGHQARAWAARCVAATDGRDPSMLDKLAAADAELGRFDDAVVTAHRALILARRQGNVRLADHLVHRLALYRQGKPVRTGASHD